MAWATVSDIKALISTTVNDMVLNDMLASAQEDVEGAVGTVSTVTTNIKNAHKYRTAVILLRYMKTNGELAYTNKIGVSHQINEIDQMIADFDREYQAIVKRYSLAAKIATYPCYHKIDNLAGEDDE